MNDIAVLYYTANKINNSFAEKIRSHLLSVIDDVPIISVSQKPLEFGHNICVGELAYSTYSIYKQILIGALCVHTEYVACCEDDAVYPKDHFYCRPPLGMFGYNVHKWWVNPTEFFYRTRVNMIGCIVQTELLVEVLAERFSKFPRVLKLDELHGWGEPGKSKHLKGLKNPPISIFSTKTPILAINHDESTGGKRRIGVTDRKEEWLEGVGSAEEIWRKFCCE